MKALIKATALSGLVTILVLSHLVSMRSQTHTMDAIAGAALEPLNILSVLALYGFGFLTAVLLLACLGFYIIHLINRRRLKTHTPGKHR